MQCLRRLHNINHFVVSQTNPHVISFLSGLEDHGPVGNARRTLYSGLRRSALAAMMIGRVSVPSELIKRYIDTASCIPDQDYHGNITILPKVSMWRYAKGTAIRRWET